MQRERMALTPELVARAHRDVADTGPEPGLTHLAESDYDAMVQALLEAERSRGDVWLFAYGSLIWRPACDVADQHLGVLRGWHRAFCLRITRWRGTKERPGLMMALDRGGRCRGMLQRLPAADAPASIGKLLRREMSSLPPSNVPRWVSVLALGGPVRALAFTADRGGYHYVPEPSAIETADILATAVGHWGSCAEYLYQTVAHLEAVGIRDRKLWRLQRMVAERIAAAPHRPA